jgi:hypothetical protein
MALKCMQMLLKLKASLDKLVKLNNKLLRILLNKKLSTHVPELYATFNLLSVSNLHEMQMLLFTHKCFHHKNLLPNIFHNYFTLNKSVHQYATRRSSDVHLSSINSKFGQRSSAYRGGTYWNNLPDCLKYPMSLFQFKRKVKKYLVDRNS